MKNKKNILFLLFYLFLSAATAQEVPEVIAFTDPNILNEQVWSITQMEDNRMCFGTSDGLIFFDGSQWNSFEPSYQDIIRVVSADEKGRIYKGNYDEFGYWEKDTLDQLQYFSLSKKISIETKEEIWNILRVGELIYFQSFSAIYKYANGKVESIKPEGNIMFLQAVRGRILFQQIGGGIYEMNSSNQFKLLPSTLFFSDKKVVFILPYKESGLLIGTEHHGVYVWDNEEINIWNIPLQKEFKTNQLNKGIQLSNGSYAFGTILKGVYILDKNGNKKIHLNREQGLPDNTVLSLLEDTSGNLWLGLDKGVAIVNVKNTLLFFKDVNGTLGTVYTAAEFDNHLYVGTNRGVFFKKKSTKNTFSSNKFQFISGTQGQVWELKVFGDELLGGHNEGTFSISKNHKINKISSNSGGWTTQYLTENKDLLIQGTYSGMVVFKKNKIGKWSLAHRINGFSEPVKEMVIDKKGAIWLAHPLEGLYRVFLDNTKKEVALIHKFSEKDGLPSDKKMALIYEEGQVFVQSEKKWLWFNEKTKQFERSRDFNHFPLEKIQGKICQGKEGDWFEVLPHQVNCFINDKKNTLSLPLVGDYENIITLSDGKYLFCLDDGYAMLHAANLMQDTIENYPKVTINRLEFLEEDSIQKVVLQEASLRLKSYQNRLRFHFYQPHYTNMPLFRYRLLGLENNWSPWTEKSEKEYFNLHSGKYTFIVESKFGHQSTSVKFEILPHWSQTWLAYLFYFLGFIALLWLLQRYQKKEFEATKQQMQADQKRFLAEQQMQADNEKLHLDIVNKSKQLANSTMNLVQKNEILLQIKNELLLHKKKSDGSIKSKDYQQLLHLIDTHLTSKQDWELFEKNFNQVHELFLKKLKVDFPQLTPGDLQLAAYLKMNLTSKEIAPLLHISIRGIENKRYRLRKKLGLAKDGNLTEFLMKY